jgi:hypothetical protein
MARPVENFSLSTISCEISVPCNEARGHSAMAVFR